MSVANEIRWLFLAGLLLLAVLAVAVQLSVGWGVAAWRARRERATMRAAAPRGVLEI